MEPFAKISLLEQIRRERFARTQKRSLRLQLLAKRNLIEARLEERRLEYLTSKPGYGALSEKIRGLVAFSYVHNRAAFLTKAVRSIRDGNAVDKKLAEIRQAIAGSVDP
jgi:hypothetical protein